MTHPFVTLLDSLNANNRRELRLSFDYFEELVKDRLTTFGAQSTRTWVKEMASKYGFTIDFREGALPPYFMLTKVAPSEDLMRGKLHETA